MILDFLFRVTVVSCYEIVFFFVCNLKILSHLFSLCYQCVTVVIDITHNTMSNTSGWYLASKTKIDI